VITTETEGAVKNFRKYKMAHEKTEATRAVYTQSEQHSRHYNCTEVFINNNTGKEINTQNKVYAYSKGYTNSHG